MNKENIIAKNEKASIALDTDGGIVIDAKEISKKQTPLSSQDRGGARFFKDER